MVDDHHQLDAVDAGDMFAKRDVADHQILMKPCPLAPNPNLGQGQFNRDDFDIDDVTETPKASHRPDVTADCSAASPALDSGSVQHAPTPIAVLGMSGTGRSHRLAEWAESVRRSTGTLPRIVDARTRADNPTTIQSALVDEVVASLEAQVPIAIDNADCWAPELLDRIANHLAIHRGTLSIVASPHNSCSALDQLIDLIASTGSLVHTELLDTDATLGFIGTLPTGSISSDAAQRIELAAGGSSALIADAVSTEWFGDLDDINVALGTLVSRRVRRSGDAVGTAVELAALGAPLHVAIQLARADHGDIEPLVTSSGLFNDDQLIPLVAAVTASALTAEQRRKRSEQIISGAAHLDPTLRARLVRSARASTTGNEDRLADARAAFRLGDTDAIGLASQLTDDDPSTALLRFGTDMRMMRWADAGQRVTGHAGLAALTGLSHAFDGDVLGLDVEPGEPDERSQLLQGTEWTTCHRAIVEFARGDLGHAIGMASQAVDDATHTAADATLGVSPAAIGALLSLGAGDPGHAAGLLELAVQHDIGGPGEHRFHRLLQAIATMQTGDYTRALDAVRAGDNDRWPHRDRLMLAAIDVAVARRSGDTQRLRDGWKRAAPLLARGTVSWLYTDALTELLSAGARLGDQRQTQPLHARLAEQLRGLPASGPGSTWAVWSDLQLAVATEAWDSLPTTEAISGGNDARSRARHTAVRAWTSVGARSPDVALVHEAARELADVGDAWEASRLLGQAALDQSDQAQARALLEAARFLVAAPSSSEDGLVAAGLSEREADVARLVVDGFTHRDVGAQLFISPKTVEHHVAKVRQRLGATTRAEMLAAIRDILGTAS